MNILYIMTTIQDINLSEQENAILSAFDKNVQRYYNNQELEIEFRAGINLDKFGGNRNTINTAEFGRLVEYFRGLESGQYPMPIENATIRSKATKKKTLDIYVYETQKVNLRDEISNLRFTLNDPTDISEYCRTGDLPKNNYLIYRGDFLWNNTDEEINAVVNDGRGSFNNRKCIVDLESYRLRLGGKVELEYSYKEQKFPISDIMNEKLVELQQKAIHTYDKFTKLRKDRAGFKNLFKTYRLKERTSFSIKIGEIMMFVDLTKVKSSKRIINQFGREENLPVINFIDSELVESDESYEYEIEIANKNMYEPDQLKTLIGDIVKYIYIPSMKYMKEIPMYTTSREESDLLYIYRRLIDVYMKNKIINKLETLERVNRYKTLMVKMQNNTITSSEKTELDSLENTTDRFGFFNLIKNTNENVEYLKDKYNKQLFDIERHNYPYNTLQNYFISPKVVSIHMHDIRLENPKSINYNYCVTDKADGQGMLLYKVSLSHLLPDDKEKYKAYNNKIYLIDSNMIVYNTGITIDYEIDNVVFNGEYLRKGLSTGSIKQLLNSYGIFDTYIFNDKDVSYQDLVSKNSDDITRIKYAEAFLEKVEILSTNMEIFVKEFLIGDQSVTNIFEQTNKIWKKYNSGLTKYKLDGTIYTPINMPVGYNENDYDFDLKPNLTWTYNLKWKPAHDNTIDFLIKYEKEEVAKFGEKILYKDKVRSLSRNKSGTNVMVQYKIGNLYNGGNEASSSNPCARTTKKSLASGKFKPMLFKPTHPLDEDVYYGLFEMKEINDGGIMKKVVVDQEGLPVEDNTIVEISYTDFTPDRENYQSNRNLRWSILRTRHDKTLQYRLGLNEQKVAFAKITRCMELVNIPVERMDRRNLEFMNNCLKYVKQIPGMKINEQEYGEPLGYNVYSRNIDLIRTYFQSHEDVKVTINYGNNINVANDIWMSIHSPITEEMITTGNGIPSVYEEEDKYYKKDINQQREKSITIPLQNFHNKFIKSRLLLGNVVKYIRDNGQKEITLLDLACGKGGDIPKWRDLEIDVCVGIDLFKNNITDERDGACERYNFYKDQYVNNGKFPEMYFLVGDVSKPINTGMAFTDSNFKEMFNNLWNPNEKYNTRFNNTKFDIVSIMFALHYFFRNKSSLDNLIDNVNNNLKKGGFLLGACFDGKRIFNSLENLYVGGSLDEYKSGKLIWKIIKNYKNTTFENDDNSLGLSIKVLIYSIGQIIEEYLVNFDYFLQRLAEKGIVPCSELDMTSMNLPTINGKKTSVGSFEDVFEFLKSIPKTSNEYHLAQDILVNMTVNEKKLSFFSNYFILRKLSENDELRNNIYSYVISNRFTTSIKPLLKSYNWIKLRSEILTGMGLDDIDEAMYKSITDQLQKEIESREISLEKKKIIIHKTKKIIKPTVATLPVIEEQAKEIVEEIPEEQPEEKPVEKPEKIKGIKINIKAPAKVKKVLDPTKKAEFMKMHNSILASLEKNDSDDINSSKYLAPSRNKELFDKYVTLLSKFVQKYNKPEFILDSEVFIKINNIKEYIDKLNTRV